MKFYSKIIGFVLAMSISVSSFGGLFSLGVKITQTDSTKQDVESMIDLAKGMYGAALTTDEWKAPCISDDGSAKSGLQKPVTYVDTTGALSFVSTQTSAATTQVFTPGELASGLDAGMRRMLNDFGITKCMWAFFIFHNPSTKNYADKDTPTTFANQVSRGSLGQTAFILDPPRDANGKVVNLETISVYTTLQNDSGTSLTSNKVDNAQIIKSYTAGYTTDRCGTLPALFNPDNQTGTTQAVGVDKCPLITCGLSGTSTGKDQLVHQTKKSGTTILDSFTNGSTLCGAAS